MAPSTPPKLGADQRERIVSLLADHLDFRTEPDRWTLLDAAFGSVEGAETIRRDLDLSGAPRQAAERLVERLRSPGCIRGRHTLALLLEPIASRAGDDRSSLLGLVKDLDALCTRPAGGEPCPYLGLNAFAEQDAPWFFGREPFVQTLAAAVDASPVVAVIGSSGSGKSSVVQAGFFPLLREREDWTIASLRPGHDPWASLAGCLGDRLGVEHANDLERAQANKRLGQNLAAATARPTRDPASLTPADLIHQILAKHPSARRLLLLVDQWEELYTHRHPPSRFDDRPVHEHFADALVEATDAASLTLVLTLRADFYHRLLDHRALADAVRGAGHVDLSPMNEEELTRAIVAPAHKAGLGFETGLPARILEDLGREPGQLPLLEFCLTRLWEHRRDGVLRGAAYQAIGGVRGAIIRRADEVIEGLGATRRDQARDLFLRLVQLDEAAPDTRRRATRAEVGELVWPLAKELADARLLVTGRDPASGEQTVEVAHEALIRSWPRLRQWLEGAREGLRLQGEIRRAAKLWEKKGGDPNHRWPDVRVMEAAPVLRAIAERFPLGERECTFLGPMEAGEMLARLDDASTPDAERAMIGDRLSLLPGGDPGPGVGLLTGDGLPDLIWCDIPEGEIELAIDAKPSRLLGLLRRRRATRPGFPVEPFRMAKYPITVAQWRAFLDDPEGYDARIRQRYNGVEPGVQRGGDNQPAVSIAWVEAMAYCEWLGERLASEPGLTVRLPTEWEWQQAACSGHSDWAYPWGPDWAEGRANTIENGLGRMVAVGLYPTGASLLRIRVLAQAPFPDVAGEIEHPLGRGATRIDSDGARSAQVVRTGIVQGLIDVGAPGLVFVAPGIDAAIGSPSCPLPLPFGWESDHRAGVRKAQVLGEPGAEGHGFVPAHRLARVVGDRPVRRPGIAVRMVQAAPPAVVRVAVLGIEEDLELGMGDRIAGNPERLAGAALAVLIKEFAPGDLHPVDGRQTVGAKADASTVIQPQTPQGTADGGAGLRGRIALDVRQPRQPGTVQISQQFLPVRQGRAALQDALGGDLGLDVREPADHGGAVVRVESG